MLKLQAFLSDASVLEGKVVGYVGGSVGRVKAAADEARIVSVVNGNSDAAVVVDARENGQSG